MQDFIARPKCCPGDEGGPYHPKATNNGAVSLGSRDIDYHHRHICAGWGGVHRGLIFQRSLSFRIGGLAGRKRKGSPSTVTTSASSPSPFPPFPSSPGGGGGFIRRRRRRILKHHLPNSLLPRILKRHLPNSLLLRFIFAARAGILPRMVVCNPRDRVSRFVS